MSHKSPKIDALLAGFEELPGFDRHYAGFFHCFNAQLYYEAHDVLEEVWLPIRGQPEARFYQGLIQMAGGFVHLQKERLGPAARLFALALVNFEAYPACHAGIDLDAVRKLCRDYRAAVVDSRETVNPWSKERAPQLALPMREIDSAPSSFEADLGGPKGS
jgi:predicted metal-dependent hydrolase